MASSYTWADALTVTKPFVKNIPTTVMDVTVCDQVNSFIWRSFVWRWAVASLTSNSGVLSLVDGTQDYSIGTTTGGGLFRILRLRITRTDVTPFIAREKNLMAWLPPSLDIQGSIDSIDGIAFIPETSQLRLDKAASVPSGTSYQIDGEYQFQPVKITATASVIVFPDQYFDTVIEGLKWRYYQLGDDSRMEKQREYFMGMLDDMKAQESFGEAQAQRFPGDPFGMTRAGNPGLFGWY